MVLSCRSSSSKRAGAKIARQDNLTMHRGDAGVGVVDGNAFHPIHKIGDIVFGMSAKFLLNRPLTRSFYQS